MTNKDTGSPRLVKMVTIAALVATATAGLSACSGSSDADSTSPVSVNSDQSGGAPATDATGAPSGGSTAGGSAGGTSKPGKKDPDFPVPVVDKVPADKTADFGTGVTARLVKTSTGKLDGQGPGAIAGPSYVATVELSNRSDEAISLDTVSVTTVFGPDAVPGAAIPTDSSSDPLSGVLKPGRKAQGTYVFALPDTQSDSMSVAVSYVGDVPLVVFTDTVPR